MKRIITVLLLAASMTVEASSLQFFGNGVNDIDRVKVRIDDPANLTDPGPPADVGATDFTVEFWMRSATGNNAGAINCGANNEWILGNIMIDRDRFFQDREYGISLVDGRVAFGVTGIGLADQRTICGTTDLRDSQWHHVAVQRRRSDGFMSLYVDGTLQRSSDGPDGDISYPDNGVPENLCQPGGNTPCTNSDPFIVFGAEKHDDGPAYPSYHGWLDEIRISRVLRYGANFTRPSAAFAADAETAALYHFDEFTGDMINDAAFNSLSDGVRRFGGNPPGPVWSTETPFSGAPSPGSLSLSAASYSVNEGTATLTIPVRRTGGSSGAASVAVTVTAGTATAGTDYTVAPAMTLNWADNDALDKSIVVTIINDVQPESAETFQVALSNATGASLGSPASATATIQDNDAAPQPGTLQFSGATATVGEAAGSITLTVNRVSGTDGAVSVNYGTANGTASAGSDYTTTNGTLNLANGQASATFQVPITDDAAVEGAENFTVTLSSPSGGAALGTPVTVTVTITDNDAAPQPGTLQFSGASATVGEAAGSITLTVNRVSGTDGAVSVNYSSANGTAIAGLDYTAASATLNLANGQASATFQVPISDDAAVEGAETFTVTLASPAGGAALGTPVTVTVTITDNDAAPPPPGGGGGGGAAGWPSLGGLLLLAWLGIGRRERLSAA